MTSSGFVLGAPLRAMASVLADVYRRGELVIVAGAGVSRASGLPGWAEMVQSIQASAYPLLAAKASPAELDRVLNSLHGDDPTARADSLRRLLTDRVFTRLLHDSLFAGLPPGAAFRPSTPHWHIASLVDHTLMPDVFTSNYDDLLEDAKKALKRSGRVRHFHGRLPQSWKGTRLSDPPVVTTRDYLAAEDLGRYEKIAKALSNKTALLVGFSLADPNLTRLIRANSSDCRAVVVASATGLTPAEQNLRLNLLRRYWQGLGIEVTAVEAREELPAFLFALRREVLARENKSFAGLGEDALKRSATASPWGWSGAREWRDGFRDAVTAAKAVAPELRGDVSLRAGFYAIQRDGYIAHVVSSTTTMRSHRNEPRRTLLADSPRPWGAAGYSFAAGVPILASTGTGAFDRNVNESDLLAWQSERAAAERLPASSVLCVPAWVRYQRRLIPVGVTYFSSRRARLVTSSDDEDELKSILQLTFGAMIDSERLIEGGPA